MAYTTDLVQQKLARMSRLWARRSTFESEWIDIGDYVVPSKSLLVRGAIMGSQTVRKNYSSTAPKSAHDLASTMQGTLTNQAIRWFYLKFPSQTLNRMPEAAKWLEAVEDQMMLFKQQSNMSSEYSSMYLDLVSFATSAILLEEDRKAPVFGFRYKVLTLGEYAIAEDAQSMVNTLYRKFPMSTWELVERFGLDNVSRTVREKYEEKKFDEKFDVLHAVEPRDPEKVSHEFITVPGKRPFSSCYIEIKEGHLLEEDGYYTFPYLCGRWHTNTGEEYGRGPAHIALPDIRSLNRAVQLKFRGVSKDLDPPVEVKNASVISTVELLPSSINYVREIPSISPIQTNRKIDIAVLNEQDLKAGIKEIFYVDLTTMPPVQGTPMSATEAAQRFELMERKLGPTTGRIKTEILKRDITRSIGMMLRARVVPEPPPVVIDFFRKYGVRIDVEFEGPLERAQRFSDVKGIMDTYQALAPVAEMKPEVLDVLDHDGIARRVAQLSGLPQSMIIPEDKVAEVRKQRAEQQQQQVQTDQALTVAQAAKAGSQAVANMQPTKPGV